LAPGFGRPALRRNGSSTRQWPSAARTLRLRPGRRLLGPTKAVPATAPPPLGCQGAVGFHPISCFRLQRRPSHGSASSNVMSEPLTPASILIRIRGSVNLGQRRVHRFRREPAAGQKRRQAPPPHVVGLARQPPRPARRLL